MPASGDDAAAAAAAPVAVEVAAPAEPMHKARRSLSERALESPLVPLGSLATAGVLVYGLFSFAAGRQKQAQYAMRARVLAQGITVVAGAMAMMAAGSRR